MKLSQTIFIDRDAIAARIHELAVEVDEVLAGKPLIAVIALKGAMPMAMDFIRALKTPVQIELIRAQSYQGSESTGHVTLSILPEADFTGKTILLIEDIVDTGRTATAICEHLNTLSPAQIHIVTLLDKPSRREVPCSPDWVGFTIDDLFVVGYGMDYNEDYRDLPDIYTMELSTDH